jgi:hypothetical protein
LISESLPRSTHSVHIPVLHVGSVVGCSVVAILLVESFRLRQRVTVRVVSRVDFPAATANRSIGRARSFETSRPASSSARLDADPSGESVARGKVSSDPTVSEFTFWRSRVDRFDLIDAGDDVSTNGIVASIGGRRDGAMGRARDGVGGTGDARERRRPRRWS